MNWPKRPLLVLGMVFLVSPNSAQQLDDCSQLEVVYGATWINVTWTLHCDLAVPDIIQIQRYILTLKDLTTGLYNYTESPYCLREKCTESLVNVRACIEYELLLEVATTNTTLRYNITQFKMDEETPSAPRGVQISGQTPTELTVSWVDPERGSLCVDHYTVCSRPLHGDPQLPDCTNTTEKTLKIPGLEPCEAYEVTVQSITQKNRLGHLWATSDETAFSAPGKPINLRGKNSGPDFVSFYYTPAEENSSCFKGLSVACVEKEYQLNSTFQEEFESGGESTTESAESTTESTTESAESTTESTTESTAVSELSTEVNNLIECTNYRCSMKVTTGVNQWIESEWIEMSTSMANDLLGAPQFVDSNSLDQGLDVFWMEPRTFARCVDSYFISWSMDDTIIGMEKLSRDTFNYEITGLKACVSYLVRISAYTHSWGPVSNGTEAALKSETMTVAPGGISNLVQDSAEENSITMCWDPPTKNPYCVFDYEVTIVLDQTIPIREIHRSSADTDVGSVCRTYEVKKCSSDYVFCITPVSKNDDRGPQSCVGAVSANC